MDQLDPIAVDDPENRRGGQEGLRPVLMGREETKEPRPLGQEREQWPIVARQPAIEGPFAQAAMGVAEPPGDHLPVPKVRLRVFWVCAQPRFDGSYDHRD